jgi:predicted ATPase/DNA-binding NarL/FixJ family response regulator/transcriptional regulator with XRE-family HTH domain
VSCTPGITPNRFTTFGELLKFLRRRAGLTQLELSIAVGYSESQISRLEKNERTPDQAALAARFIPALQLNNERAWAARLLELAAASPGGGEMKTRETRTPRHNLPLQLTSFIGREREMAEVKRLLSSTRLLSLTGSGGCGKTRLAMQAASQLEDFPDGIWLADLAPLFDPALIPQSVASLFDLYQVSDTPIVTLLLNFLQSKNLLLIFDNCEHLIQGCAELCNELLRACPNLEILATSREALNTAGETAFYVPSLSMPDLQKAASIQALKQSEAVRLFIERAKAANPSLHLNDTNAPAIAQICLQLDGMPLAIELAAARVNSISVEEIAARLDDRFRLLTAGSRTALPRHRTLRALIDWSYDLLSDPERILLGRLAVFAGGFTLEAAESVCAEGNKNEILDLLSSLVQKSLVLLKLDDQPRYGLLETIRQYAREKLVESGEADAARDFHLDYFMKFAEATAPKLHGPEQMQALDRLDSELDNVRAALEWSLREGRAEKGLRLAGALAWFWERRGYWSEGRARIERLLNQPDAAPRTLIRANGLVAASLLANSLAAAWVGGSKASHPYLEEAITIAREHGQAGKRWCALALIFLSNSVYADNPILAESQCDDAWATIQELNEPWISALLIHQRAHWYENQHDYPAARKAFEDSMMLFRSVGDRRWEAILFSDLAELSSIQGDHVDARRRLEINLPYFRQTKDRQHICFSLLRLADIARTEGNYDLAKEYAVEGLGLARELGSKLQINSLTATLGFVALHDGELDAGRSLFVECLMTARVLNLKQRVATALLGLATIAVVEKQVRRAIQLFAVLDTLIEEKVKDNFGRGDEKDYNKYLTIMREQLDEVVFNKTWAEGHAMAFEQAIEFALAAPEPDLARLATIPQQTIKEKFGGLTSREREVAVLIAQGKSNPEIAKALVVSERTVTTHVTNILSKLRFTSRTQIASWATEKRLTPSETKT